MKRPLKALLLVLSVVVLLPGAFLGEALWRASRKLERERARVHADLYRLRAELASRPRFEWSLCSPALAQLRLAHPIGRFPTAELARRRAEGTFFPYEEMRPLGEGDVTAQDPINSARDAPSAGRLLVETVEASEMFHGAPLERAFARYAWERDLLAAWRRRLTMERFPADLLEEFARVLDRVEARRPSLAAALEAEHIVQRLAILRQIDSGDSYGSLITSRPGWRELFSWRVLAVRILADFDEHYRLVAPLAGLPKDQWRDAAFALAAKPAPDARWETPVRTHGPELFWHEEKLIEERALLRAAIAMLWYRAEHGAMPPDWESLIPRHLPAPPGFPISFAWEVSSE